jgi:hypothetical protein
VKIAALWEFVSIDSSQRILSSLAPNTIHEQHEGAPMMIMPATTSRIQKTIPCDGFSVTNENNEKILAKRRGSPILDVSSRVPHDRFLTKHVATSFNPSSGDYISSSPRR